MKAEIFYSFSLINKFGIPVLVRRERAHSFVAIFDQILYTKFSTSSFSVIDTVNAPHTLSASDQFSINALVSDDTFGIVVGSNLTAVLISDYKLGTKILNGTGAGTLQYGAHTIYAPAVVGTYCSFRFSRPFHNATANPITVNETGIIWKDTSNNWYFLIEHNIPTPYIISAGVGGLVTCELRITV